MERMPLARILVCLSYFFGEGGGGGDGGGVYSGVVQG